MKLIRETGRSIIQSTPCSLYAATLFSLSAATLCSLYLTNSGHSRFAVLVPEGIVKSN